MRTLTWIQPLTECAAVLMTVSMPRFLVIDIDRSKFKVKLEDRSSPCLYTAFLPARS